MVGLRLRGKLNRPWNGPFKVTGKVSESLYKVAKPDGEVVVNTERLKRYYQRKGYSSDEEDEPREVEESSDEEDNDNLLRNGIDAEDVEDEVPVPEREPALRGSPERIPQQRPAGQNVPPPADWGHRGTLRCNVDPANILLDHRTRRKN